ncbi:MAG: flagellar biosynthesis protein FlhA, partial [Symbiobacteriaceae bacterium]|nr:flagellar biosynthesis protein FlhA [Symbiobacteriaceae bacterium]
MAGVLGIVLLFILQIPTWLLDILLALNITFSVVMLLVAMSITEALQFATFPSLLLITTLYRLALNVTSIKLILLKGYAGQIVNTFGTYVAGGDPVVGFVVFFILIIIQFLVITRGAERVAEVAARFTLDAMPGKQMAIDADLNAGLINEEDAKERRRKIQREADFYGAMDGATKFVKGDAIAGIIITIVNIVGGIIIGMIAGNSLNAAALQYTILCVGSGLVMQIPALLISTATGIIVTRAASDGSMGSEVTRQLFFSQPRTLLVAAGALALMGLVPGMPPLVFLALALTMAYFGYITLQNMRREVALEDEIRRAGTVEAIRRPENIAALLAVDPIEVELGYGLLPMADSQQGGDLLDRLIMVRRQCALDLGLIVPTIRVVDNIQLNPYSYMIKIKGVEAGGSEIMLDYFLAMSNGVDIEVGGIPTTEPAFGLPALWVDAANREYAELAGYTVVDPPTVIITHLTQIIKTSAHQLLGRQEVQQLVALVKQGYPAVIDELTPQLMSLGEIQKVLANLLKEGIPIRDLVTIFETLGDYGRMTKDPDMLTEYVRQALSRTISRPLQGDGPLQVLTLNPNLERTIMDAVQHSEQGAFLNLDSQTTQKIYQSLNAEINKLTGFTQPVIVASPLVRLYFRRLTERVAPQIQVVSYNELDPSMQ